MKLRGMFRPLRAVGLGLVLLLLLLVFARPAHAETSDGNSWSTLLYSTRLDVGRDNTAKITEVINFDFGQSPGHGIERYIPLWIRYNHSWRYLHYNFNLQSITVDQESAPYTSSKRGINQYLRIGDPNQTITGVHSYRIIYTMSPVVQDDPAGDYLNWNLIGTNWNTTISRAVASVHLPSGVAINQSRCYTGSQGSTTQDCTVVTNPDQSLQIEAKDGLSYHQGLTINLITDHGVFSNYLKPAGVPPTVLTNVVGVGLGILALLAGIVIRFVSWVAERRRKANQTVIAEYDPPDNLSPAEMGMLHDSEVSAIEITATIIDLAVRGYIKLELLRLKSFFRSANYKIHFLKAADSQLRAHESILYDMLMSGNEGTGTVETKSLKGNTVSSAIMKFRKSLDKAVKDKGYYKKTSKVSNVVVLKFGIPLLRFAFFIVFLVFSIRAISDNGWLGLIIGLVGVLLGFTLSRRSAMRASGVSEWAKVEGFKLFLSVTEKDRLAFTDAPAKTPEQFSKFLPYAIALGVEKQWAGQFADMDIRRASGWYISPYPFYAPVDFVNNLNTNLPSGFSAVTTSSSGGFSGGGGAGGGGGGGGGGGW